MSHFVVYVLKTPGIKTDDEAFLDSMLARYSEEREVQIHEEECYCVGRAAIRRAEDAADEKHGSIDNIRNKVWDDPRIAHLKGDLPYSRTDKDEALVDQVWEEYRQPWKQTMQAALDADPDKDKPNPKCDECGGTGSYESTRNDEGYWDWWVRGGRWTGIFASEAEQPENNPKNYETCKQCNGTGLRNDKIGREERERDPAYTCNGCSGKGKHMKWGDWERTSDNDQIKVSELLKREDLDKLIPFAIVTPDGKWHQKGKMGWWAMVSDKQNDWPEKAKELLAAHKNAIAIAVDCHV